MKKPKTKELVRVTWLDSSFRNGWQNAGSSTIPTITSIGYVSAKDPNHLELSATMGSDGSVLNPLAIPWGCIVKIEAI